MSNKYIVKNCPVAFNTKFDGTYCNDVEITLKNTHCQHINYCLIKQVIEKCKGIQEKFYDAVHSRYLSPSKATFAREILQLFDIEEVE